MRTSDLKTMLWITFFFTSIRTTLPSILFPHYPYHKTSLAIFDHFLNSTTIAGKLDCSHFPTICAFHRLTPGKVHVLLPNGLYRPIQRPFSSSSLLQLSDDLSVSNWVQFDTIDQIIEFANRSRLFCLVARSNAGDLEQKQSVIRTLALNSIDLNAAFGIILDSELYERFGRYPLTTFVYISQNLSSDTFRGDFEMDRLADFLRTHDPSIQSGYRKIEIDSQTKLRELLCLDGLRCFICVDFERFRAIPLDDGDQIEEMIPEFEKIWRQFGRGKRARITFELWREFRPGTVGIGGIGLGLGLIGIVLYMIDLKNEIPDERRKKD
jgi:hypothetical protein